MTTSSGSAKRTAKRGSPSGKVSSNGVLMSLAKSVAADDAGIHVTFEDGRVITAPLTQRLRAATRSQRSAGEVQGLGTWLHWKEIDEDLGVDYVLGVDEDEFLDFAGLVDATGLSEE